MCNQWSPTASHYNQNHRLPRQLCSPHSNSFSIFFGNSHPQTYPFLKLCHEHWSLDPLLSGSLPFIRISYLHFFNPFSFSLQFCGGFCIRFLVGVCCFFLIFHQIKNFIKKIQKIWSRFFFFNLNFPCPFHVCMHGQSHKLKKKE